MGCRGDPGAVGVGTGAVSEGTGAVGEDIGAAGLEGASGVVGAKDRVNRRCKIS